MSSKPGPQSPPPGQGDLPASVTRVAFPSLLIGTCPCAPSKCRWVRGGHGPVRLLEYEALPEGGFRFVRELLPGDFDEAGTKTLRDQGIIGDQQPKA